MAGAGTARKKRANGVYAVRVLTAYAVAGADGLFIQREVDGDDIDLVALFELHARLVHDAAIRVGVG